MLSKDRMMLVKRIKKYLFNPTSDNPNLVHVETLTSETMIEVGARALRKHFNLMQGHENNGEDFIEIDVFESRIVLEAIANHIQHNNLVDNQASRKITDEFGNYREDIPHAHPKESGYRYVHTSKAGMRIYFNDNNGSMRFEPSDPEKVRLERADFIKRIKSHLEKTGGKLF